MTCGNTGNRAPGQPQHHRPDITAHPAVGPNGRVATAASNGGDDVTVQHKIVPGVTTSRIPARRSMGNVRHPRTGAGEEAAFPGT
jgi:hypothetical protein